MRKLTMALLGAAWALGCGDDGGSAAADSALGGAEGNMTAPDGAQVGVAGTGGDDASGLLPGATSTAAASGTSAGQNALPTTQAGGASGSPSSEAILDVGGASAQPVGVSTPTPAAVAIPVEPSDPTTQPETDPAEVPSTINPFVMTQHDPLSTFAVDVDTASYDIFRRDVQNGVLPLPENVRVEEFINYFDYDYASPETAALVELLQEGSVPEEQGASEPFAIHLDASPSLADNGTTLLRVGIKGQQIAPTVDQPANLVFLVDVSGSMASAEKLPLVQYLLLETLDVLRPTDTVSIVTYAGSTQVALGPTPVSDAATISNVINGLQAGGGTAGGAGMQLAYEQARSAYVEGGVNNVILCTDGDFNIGLSSNDELLELIEEERRTGVTLTALGFGSVNNDSMMEAVSNAGNGTYAVIYNPNQASEFVEYRMLSAFQYIAKDVKLQVEFNEDHVLAYRLLGYENRAIADEDFRDDKVDAGEIGAGHSVTALYELVLAGGMVPSSAPAAMDGDAFDGEVEVAEDELVRVKVRYKDVDASALDEAYEVYVGLTPEEIADSHRSLSPSFQWAVAVATFAEVLRGSPYVDGAALPMIQQVVDDQVADDPAKTEFATLFARASALMDGETLGSQATGFR